MSKINPYDLPKEHKSIHVILRNIEWDTNQVRNPEGRLPVNMRIPLDPSTPRPLIVAKAMDVASSVWGFAILDCDVDPVDLDDTVEYEGDILSSL
ncbi:MAG: hypothetical protein CL429_03850 [Acidimicrobiaceae bacterium]|nr:hypothetical protein [Acidimicrobiaceae bacterium]